MIGYGRQMRLQASILVDISFGILTDQRVSVLRSLSNVSAFDLVQSV